jgi:hypothetical protein
MLLNKIVVEEMEIVPFTRTCSTKDNYKGICEIPEVSRILLGVSK